MPLHVPPAPSPALRTVLTALGSPTAVREARTRPRMAQDPSPPNSLCPYTFFLDRITPAGASTTRLAGWRFLIRSGERSVAAADTMLTPDGWAFSHFFEGPYIASTERALRHAENMSQPYQARLLSVPELYMLTLWLHGDCAAGWRHRAPGRHRSPGAARARATRYRRASPAPRRRTPPGPHAPALPPHCSARPRNRAPGRAASASPRAPPPSSRSRGTLPPDPVRSLGPHSALLPGDAPPTRLAPSGHHEPPEGTVQLD